MKKSTLKVIMTILIILTVATTMANIAFATTPKDIKRNIYDCRHRDNKYWTKNCWYFTNCWYCFISSNINSIGY